MVIKNKDGSVYKISCPNPLMEEQTFWGDFKKHNFDWLPEVVKDGTFNPLQESIIKEKEQRSDLNKDAERHVEKKEVKEDVAQSPPKQQIKKYNTISCYCLPAKNTEKKDDLYEEYYKRTEYADKTVVEIIILEKDDLYIKFWCEDQLTEKTIVYPKNKDKRWWKVSQGTDAPKGYYYIANISDYTPSFE